VQSGKTIRLYTRILL